MTSSPLPQATTRRAEVVDAVRAELARKRIPQSELSRLLGGSQSAWGRRMTGEIAFDVDELFKLSELLDVSIGVFFGIEGGSPRRPGGGRARQPTGPYAGQLFLLPDPADLHQEFIAHPDAA